ncbi:SDR family NAD(P)-dependent oxidoreductase [Chitinimonas sp.]|uniref:SDR family NAD(P)-dependent oxidoreductase n=1 Tax=Chitinimonas sp. TaxID=1934313 RepID=UPI0035AE1901
MDSYLISGASRGLGLGLAQAVARRGGRLLALARRESTELAALGAQLPHYRFIACDLADSAHTSALGATLMAEVAGSGGNAYLINNAGVVEPIAPAGQYDDAALLHCLSINLAAAILLSNAFIRQFSGREGDYRILNISSGAARKPYPGWSAYCSSKAGLDMYSRCAGLEQQALANGVRIASVAPGVIDTGMQAAIRGHDSLSFPQVAQFHQLQADGLLRSPAQSGSELLALLHGELLGFGSVLDIRDLT